LNSLFKLADRLGEVGIKRFRRSLSLRFVLIGCVNTVFSYCIFAALLILGAGIEIGSLLTLIVGICFGYYTQGSIVFRYTSNAAFGRFVAAWALIYVANLAIIRSLVACGLGSYLAVAIAMGPTVAISYFIQKLAVFRQTEEKAL
jgi:putative flippase GtrA